MINYNNNSVTKVIEDNSARSIAVDNDNYFTVILKAILENNDCAEDPECKNKTLVTLLAFLYGMIFIFSFLGNSTISFLTLKHRIGSRIRAQTYIMNIVIIDLVFTCIYIPIKIGNTINNDDSNIQSEFLCKVLESFKFLLISININITAALSICRWQVARNNNFRTNVKSLDKLYIQIVWAISIFTTIPSGFVHVMVKSNSTVSMCGEQWHTSKNIVHDYLYQVYVNLVHFSVPMFIICIAYGHICFIIRKGKFNYRAPKNNSLRKKSQKVMHFTIVLMLNFILCRLPFQIWKVLLLTTTWFYFQFTHPYVQSFLYLLSISYCCFNPIIVLIFDSIYQKQLQQDLKRLRTKLWSYYQRVFDSKRGLFCKNQQGNMYVRSKIINGSNQVSKFIDYPLLVHYVIPRMMMNGSLKWGGNNNH